MGYGIFRIAKLKTMGNLKGSLAHARREQDTPNANLELMSGNLLLTDTPTVESVLKKYEELKPDKIRADQVRALEVLITASPESMKQMTREKQIEFLKRGLEFANKEFGGEKNLLHAEIHFDETTPHLTAFYIPLVTSRNARSGKVKTGLNAKKLTGNKNEFMERQTRFYEQVSRHYGLERGDVGSKATHKKISQWYSELNKEELTNVVPDVVKSLEEKARTSETVEVDEFKNNLLGVFSQTKTVEKKVTFNSPMVSLDDVVKTMSPYMQTGAISKMREREKQAFKKQARKEVEAEIKEKIEEAEKAKESALIMEAQAKMELESSLENAVAEAHRFYTELLKELNYYGVVDFHSDVDTLKDKAVGIVKNSRLLSVEFKKLKEFKSDVDKEIGEWKDRNTGKNTFNNFQEYAESFRIGKEFFENLSRENKELKEKNRDYLSQKLNFEANFKEAEEKRKGLQFSFNQIKEMLRDFWKGDLISSVKEVVSVAKKTFDKDFIKEKYLEHCQKTIDEKVDYIIRDFEYASNNMNSYKSRANAFNNANRLLEEVVNYVGSNVDQDLVKKINEVGGNANEAMERDRHLASVQHPRMRM